MSHIAPVLPMGSFFGGRFAAPEAAFSAPPASASLRSEILTARLSANRAIASLPRSALLSIAVCPTRWRNA